MKIKLLGYLEEPNRVIFGSSDNERITISNLKNWFRVWCLQQGIYCTCMYVSPTERNFGRYHCLHIHNTQFGMENPMLLHSEILLHLLHRPFYNSRQKSDLSPEKIRLIETALSLS